MYAREHTHHPGSSTEHLSKMHFGTNMAAYSKWRPVPLSFPLWNICLAFLNWETQFALQFVPQLALTKNTMPWPRRVVKYIFILGLFVFMILNHRFSMSQDWMFIQGGLLETPFTYSTPTSLFFQDKVVRTLTQSKKKLKLVMWVCETLSSLCSHWSVEGRKNIVSAKWKGVEN